MKYLLRKCISCGEYTLKEVCPYCKGKVRIPHPPRFSIEDRVGKWRRQLKKEVYKELNISDIREELH
ncbi:MAG: RNA-protein complex protein Nop10 [Candidatus Jordarchaeaceae archaeon]